MARKVTLKIGDRVSHKDVPKVLGVIVHKQKTESPLVEEGKIYSVHWYNPPKLIKRRDMTNGRGIYSQDELIKDKPKKKVVIDE